MNACFDFEVKIFIKFLLNFLDSEQSKKFISFIIECFLFLMLIIENKI